jgi:predicted nuclease of predicted toxin-antitoxin system
MDVHVRRAVVLALRLRNVDVLTAQEDGTAQYEDDDLLDRARQCGRVLFSQDEDLLDEATTRQRANKEFAGVIYAHQQNVTVRRMIDDLELLAKACEPEELRNRVIFLPLK